MTVEQWIAEAPDNVWVNQTGDMFFLYWTNKPTVTQHSVITAGSKDYLLKLVELASQGFNPDINVEGVLSWLDGEAEGEVIKRGLVKA